MNSWLEWVALVSSLLTILSITVNIVQWRERASLMDHLRARSQAAFNEFCSVADLAYRLLNRPEVPAEVAGPANRIYGLTNAARWEIDSFCREHLRVVPRYEMPRKPSPTPLRKVKEPKEPKDPSTKNAT
jgi:hypothetical protein